jgi:hypothetical protein
MKKVNFIDPLPPYKQYELRRWFWWTVVIWIISFMIGAYYVAPQLLLYSALKKEIRVLREKTTPYAATAHNKEALKSEHELLSKQSNKINQYIEQPKNPHKYIAAIMEASGNGVKLESLKFNKKDVELTVVCPTPEHATVFIKRLSASDLFAGIKLVSLQHDTQGNQFRAVIKGNIVI